MYECVSGSKTAQSFQQPATTGCPCRQTAINIRCRLRKQKSRTQATTRYRPLTKLRDFRVPPICWSSVRRPEFIYFIRNVFSQGWSEIVGGIVKGPHSAECCIPLIGLNYARMFCCSTSSPSPIGLNNKSMLAYAGTIVT